MTKSNNFSSLFILILWITIWLSIGINPDYLIEFIEKYKHDRSSKKEILKFLRIFIPAILSIFWLVFIISKIKENFRRGFFINWSSLFLCLYFFVQFIFLFFTDNQIINIYWIYFAFMMLTITNHVLNHKNENFCKILVILSAIILTLVFVKFTFPLFSNFFSSNLSFYNMWPQVYEFDFTVPRPTGLSRTALILIVFLISFNFNNDIYKLIRFPSIIFLGMSICLFQSRTIIFLWPLTIFLSVIFENKSLVSKLKKINFIASNIILHNEPW